MEAWGLAVGLKRQTSLQNSVYVQNYALADSKEVLQLLGVQSTITCFPFPAFVINVLFFFQPVILLPQRQNVTMHYN